MNFGEDGLSVHEREAIEYLEHLMMGERTCVMVLYEKDARPLINALKWALAQEGFEGLKATDLKVVGGKKWFVVRDYTKCVSVAGEQACKVIHVDFKNRKRVAA